MLSNHSPCVFFQETKSVFFLNYLWETDWKKYNRERVDLWKNGIPDKTAKVYNGNWATLVGKHKLTLHELQFVCHGQISASFQHCKFYINKYCMRKVETLKHILFDCKGSLKNSSRTYTPPPLDVAYIFWKTQLYWTLFLHHIHRVVSSTCWLEVAKHRYQYLIWFQGHLLLKLEK